jgi:voltage-gated potassium channel Kch/K+/H+ antiporter YhaU regulatory subunit KhtT
MLLVTAGGIFIVSALIGIITTGLESKLEELRKGRSFVVESNHTLILGWSPKIFTIISELLIANENQKNPRIVIMADKDKVEMEDEIKSKIDNFKNTKVICRDGSPTDLGDLSIVNLNESKSIIILQPEEQNDPDIYVIKVILAITNNPERKEGAYHIVAEIGDKKNLDVAKMVGKDEVELIASNDLIARITVQTSLQSGLSIVYTELMDFDGDEIYFSQDASLVGKTFGEILNRFNESSVMGIYNSKAILNPPMDYVISEEDQIVLITEDDDKAVVNDEADVSISQDAFNEAEDMVVGPSNILIMGWNLRGKMILTEFNNYLKKGSQVTIVSSDESTEKAVLECQNLFENLTINYQFADTTDRQVIESLNLKGFVSIIILCYSDILDAQEADSKTLVTLLHLRDISEKLKVHFNVVSEILDVRNRELAQVTKADDFVVSDKLTSLMLSQISENKYLNSVFADVFDADGSEIYLKPVENYVKLNTPVNFYTVVESARLKQQVAIGYKKSAYSQDSSMSYGVVVNPNKAESVEFEEGDKLIVVAED